MYRQFKGQRVGDNKRVTGSLFIGNIPYDPKRKTNDYYIISLYNRPDKVNPKTVARSIGLKDKHGKEIYDKDKFRYKDEYFDYESRVEWNCQFAC